MRRAVTTALLVVAAIGAAPSAAWARYEGNFNLFAGQKWLNHGDWAPVDEQPELGLSLAFGEERAPIHFALDVLASRESADAVSPLYGPVRVKASTTEYSMGVRKIWKRGATRPFLGAGGCLIDVRLGLDSALGSPQYSDRAYGVWIEGGIFWRVAGHLNLGLDVRYSKADARLHAAAASFDVAAGGLHAGALIGYGW